MNRRIGLTVSLIVCMIFILSAGRAWAATITVGPGGDYSTISDAVAASSSEDTLLVMNGTYSENVVINKSLIIESENGSSSTTITAASDASAAVEITASYVQFSGFTVQHSGQSLGSSASGIYLNGAEYCTISENEVVSCDSGIRMHQAKYCKIFNNSFSINSAYGIEFDEGTHYNTFSGNTCNGNAVGGINVELAVDNTFYENHFSSNGEQGLHIYSSTGNIFYSNYFEGNGSYGLLVQLANGNTWYHNNFVGNLTMNVLVTNISTSNNFGSTSIVVYTYQGNNYTSPIGNYYDDYTGTDGDGDGLGDTAYTIAANDDVHPLVESIDQYQLLSTASYTITPSAGPNGSIDPDTPQTVPAGSDVTFTMTPDPGYYVEDVLVSGTSVGAVVSYTITDVQTDGTISVTFSANPPAGLVITPSAGVGGTISPSTPQQLSTGDDMTFSFIPDAKYRVARVLVDNVNIGAPTSYTFQNVQIGHTIHVEFEVIPGEETVQSGDGGGGGCFIRAVDSL